MARNVKTLKQDVQISSPSLHVTHLLSSQKFKVSRCLHILCECLLYYVSKDVGYIISLRQNVKLKDWHSDI